MSNGTKLDELRPETLNALAGTFAQLDPARQADLADHAARLLEQQEGEGQ